MSVCNESSLVAVSTIGCRAIEFEVDTSHYHIAFNQPTKEANVFRGYTFREK